MTEYLPRGPYAGVWAGLTGNTPGQPIPPWPYGDDPLFDDVVYMFMADQVAPYEDNGRRLFLDNTGQHVTDVGPTSTGAVFSGTGSDTYIANPLANNIRYGDDGDPLWRLNNANNIWTWESFVKVPDYTGTSSYGFFYQYHTPIADRTFAIFVQDGGTNLQPVYYWEFDGRSVATGTSGARPGAAQYHHLCYIWDSFGMTVLMDGVKIGERDQTGREGVSLTATRSPRGHMYMDIRGVRITIGQSRYDRNGFTPPVGFGRPPS
ncbi:MAG: hypothetical protein HRU14_18410 [Planctomycetes bacterium]|nr:hypothetical protein [Planctomycetota bacterium]